mgnify:CR=1 FL=1
MGKRVKLPQSGIDIENISNRNVFGIASKRALSDKSDEKYE